MEEGNAHQTEQPAEGPVQVGPGRAPVMGAPDRPAAAFLAQLRTAAWTRWLRRTILPGISGFEGQRYLLKWLLLSTIIGLVAGLGAVAFDLAIRLSTGVFLGQLVGYLPPAPLGESEGKVQIVAMARPWLLPLVTALGGLLSGLIVFTLAPEAEGHGTDAAIAAIHHHAGRMRARIPPIKLVASAITIGSGGSAGREGPSAQISAGVGALLGEWIHLNNQDRRIAVAAGIGAGIGAIFRAPLGGAIMAAEILYVHDLEVEALIPGLIASIVGYSVFGILRGFTPIFGAQPQLGFDSPVQLIYYAILGVLAGLGGLLYAKSFYRITDTFHHMPLPRWLKPAIGGLVVGLIGIVLPQSLHTGYGWVQITMSQDIFLLPLWVILVLPFAKILATSLSIGSGGSGGIFGPGMVIGATIGAAFWRLAYGVVPGIPTEPAPFIIIGMMATFGGIAHAPLAMMLMVAEMTGNLSLLAPAMVAVAISTALVGDATIYRSQLLHRADSPAHRVRFSFPLLSSLLVRDAMSAPGPVVGIDSSLQACAPDAAEEQDLGVTVLDAHGRIAGTVDLDRLQAIPAVEWEQLRVDAVLAPYVVLLEPNQPLDEALERLSEQGLSWAPVVEGGQLVGRLTVRNAIRVYKSTLRRSIRRTTALAPNTTLFEVCLTPASPLAGQMLRNAGLPHDTLVVAVTRDGETIFPRASTELKAGDVVMIMANATSEAALQHYVEGTL